MKPSTSGKSKPQSKSGLNSPKRTVKYDTLTHSLSYKSSLILDGKDYDNKEVLDLSKIPEVYRVVIVKASHLAMSFANGHDIGKKRVITNGKLDAKTEEGSKESNSNEESSKVLPSLLEEFYSFVLKNCVPSEDKTNEATETSASST